MYEHQNFYFIIVYLLANVYLFILAPHMSLKYSRVIITDEYINTNMVNILEHAEQIQMSSVAEIPSMIDELLYTKVNTK